MTNKKKNRRKVRKNKEYKADELRLSDKVKNCEDEKLNNSFFPVRIAGVHFIISFLFSFSS